ncbi:MAG: type II secretion system F family protein [Candidatus Gracilibacteria bacterium]
MAIYRYKAVNKKGEIDPGEVEASNREDLIAYLTKRGLTLLELDEKKGFGGGKSTKFGGGVSLSLLDRYMLFENLHTMVSAGLPIADSIRILIEDTDNSSIKRLLSDFQFTIEKGSPLSTSLEHYPMLFPDVVTNLIKAGEASGNLEKSLKTIATQFNKDNALKNKIVGAMIYPAILMSLSVFVIIFMFIFVIPKLSTFFAQSDMKLPAFTQIIVSTGNLVSSNYLADAIILGLLIGFLIFLAKTLIGRSIVSGFIARFPLTRKLFKQLNIYRYCWTMGILLSSGISILDSLDITGKILSGKIYKQGIERIKEDVAKGVPLGSTLKDQKNLFPQIVSGMTTVGEQTGDLENIYITLAKFYQRNFEQTLKALMTLLEPLMLLGMGLIIGGIALAIILPIYQFVAGGVR